LSDFETCSYNSDQESGLFHLGKPFMAAGSDNFINELLKLNHFQNIYDTKGRYPAVAIEDIVAEGDPDFVFLLQNPIL
jgi:ABC-type Fe3+-hydroxamate transport system substrate-binding protein